MTIGGVPHGLFSSGVDIISKYNQYRCLGSEFFCIWAIGNGPVFHAWMFRLLGSQPTFKLIHFEVGHLNIFEIKHFKKKHEAVTSWIILVIF